jgi:hypothetical protein
LVNSNSQTRQLASSPILIGAAVTVMLMVIAAVYLPDIGRGFVKDDFGWIRDTRVARVDPVQLVSLSHPGFYRPLVTATFAVDSVMYGINARGYGFTNLALYLACVGSIWALLREARVSPTAATLGAFAWALNPHGINMAVVWISGRTSLLLTLCATLSARAFLRRQRVSGSLLLFAALLAKEEATVLPFIVAAWLLALRHERGRDLVLDLAAMAVPLMLYVVLREQTPALTPATAPWFYRPSADPGLLAHNALEYLDRGATIFGVTALTAWAIYRPGPFALPSGLVAASAAWFVGGYVLTVWIPVRSSLYAVFPSVGSALLCAGVIDAFRSARPVSETASDSGADRGSDTGSAIAAGLHGLRVHRTPTLPGDARLAIVLASVLALIPIYQQRNDRWVEPARLSARTIEAIAASPPSNVRGTVVFEDEDAQFASFSDAFGDFAGEAVLEATHRALAARIERSGARWTGPVAARYKLTRGRIDRVTP